MTNSAVVALLAALPLAARAAPKKPRLAVTDLQVSKGVDAGLARQLAEVVLAELSRSGKYDVIGSSDIAAMLGFERQKKLLGCTDDAACLTEIGGALGVEYVVNGQLGRIGSRYRVDLKLLDVRQGRVAAREGDFAPGDEDALAAAVQRLTRRLVGAPDPAPAAAVSSKEPPAPSRGLGYGLLGGAAALVAVGAGAGVMARNTFADLAGRDHADPAYVAYYDGHIGTLHAEQNVADAGYALGAVAAAAGIYILVRSPPAEVSLAPAHGGGFAVVRGTF